MRLELKQVTKQLSGFDVLDAIDLVLDGSQIIALLGANGAGKTTLLHVLGGLYRPTSGIYLFDGVPMQRRRLDQRRRLHYVPDIPVLNPQQSPIEYIVYACDAYQKQSAEVDAVLVDLLDDSAGK